MSLSIDTVAIRIQIFNESRTKSQLTDLRHSAATMIRTSSSQGDKLPGRTLNRMSISPIRGLKKEVI